MLLYFMQTETWLFTTNSHAYSDSLYTVTANLSNVTLNSNRNSAHPSSTTSPSRHAPRVPKKWLLGGCRESSNYMVAPNIYNVV